jgi:hypothetical protein
VTTRRSIAWGENCQPRNKLTLDGPVSLPFGDSRELARTAPLRQWTVFGRYDSARECSDERTKMIRVQSMALLSDLAEGVSDANRPSLSLDFKHAQCIASDDPRLKKK